jgi:hypothetical protein
VSFESAEERYEDLETVVAGYGEEARDGHVHGERGRDGPCLPGTRYILSCHDRPAVGSTAVMTRRVGGID